MHACCSPSGSRKLGHTYTTQLAAAGHLQRLLSLP
jgi:hypothetical protein